MAKTNHIDEAGFLAWLATRPTAIQVLAVKYPPNVLYRMESGRCSGRCWGRCKK